MRSRLTALTHLIVGFVTLLALLCATTGCFFQEPRIQGTVRDATDGSPLAGATVSVGESSVSTRRDGRYTLTLANGDHTIHASAPGYVRQELTLSVDQASRRQERDIALQRRQVTGQVLDATSGHPLAGAQIASDSAQTSTGPGGQFTMDLVVASSLAVTARGYMPVQLADAEVGALFDESGRANEALVLSLSPRVLTGTVSDGERSLAGVEVSVGEQSTHTDQAGHYELTHVEPGEWVSFAHAEYQPQQGPEYTGQSSMDAILTPWQVLLRVRDAQTDQPIAGAEIVLEGASILADGMGEAAFRILPGVQLEVRAFGYRAETQVYQGEDTLHLGLQPVGVAGVVLRQGDQQPIAGATVLVMASEAEPKLLHTDGQGRFVLEEEAAVTQMVAKSPGYRRAIADLAGAGFVTIELEPFEARAIYIPFGLLKLPERIEELLTLVEETELNAVVVDVKGDRARLAWDSQVPLAREMGAYDDDVMDLRQFLQACHERGIYTIARMVVFKDDLLAEARAELAVKRESGVAYADLEDLRWVDPFHQEVQDYNISLAQEIAAMGFDEVQFDYLRFPSDGSVTGLVYSQPATFDGRTEAIAAFCARAHEALSWSPAFFSADVFGLTPWVVPEGDMGIGQRIDDIAPGTDYLSPMLYPTTFAMEALGYPNPGLFPYGVIYRSVLKARERTDTLVRPWLQAYSIGGIEYGPVEMLKQRRAAEDAGSSGWIFWHSGGSYPREVFEADAYERYPQVLDSSERRAD